MRKTLPNLDVDSRGLFKLSHNALKWELLKTALELGVFDLLSDPATAEEVSRALSTHPMNTEYMLNALVAIECLTKTDGRFKNAPLAEYFLTTGKDTSIGAAILFMDHWSDPVLNGGLLKLVKNGPPPPRDIGNDELWEIGARASLNHSRCGRAQLMAAKISALPEFSSFSKMLDLGAGPGIIGIAVAAAHPSLECVLFDQPAVCKVAEEVIAEYGMGDRVATMCGHYMDDPIGENYDFVMANLSLNFYRDRLVEVMTKVHEALNPGGVFVVTSDGMNKEKTAPTPTVITWLSTCLQGMDMAFEEGIIARAMLDAGFVSTQREVLPPVPLEAHWPIEMTIGRKSKAI